MIYANQAGTSWPKPPGVVEAVQHALGAAPTGNAARFRAAHARVARFFDLPAAERLLFAPSCTAALAVLLGDFAWREGDRVLTSSLEHHALLRPLQKLTWERGVAHSSAPYRPGAPLDLDWIEGELRRGGVRMVACTGASNVTGELLPIAELVRLAHAHGALVLLDAAQTAGLLPLGVAALGVDLLAFAGHKALHGPLGIGGLWAAPHVPFVCPSASCEVGGDAGARPSPYPGFCDVGSVNLPAMHGLAAAMDWLDGLDTAQRESPMRLAAALREGCRQRPSCRVLGGDGPHTATVSMVVDGLPLDRAQQHFVEHGLVVRVGQHCAPSALRATGAVEGCLRLSFGVTNRDDDVTAALAALDAAVPDGR
ncbi:MAG: aminotransferase class V-fold PLP-dependent enzyme [Planctomycetes bacterium]|nr:aminotransferase class V-fold PLP-dependent enzyme [Planctomycetota bacterium]